MRAIDCAYSIGIDMDDGEDLKNLAKNFASINENSSEVFNGVILAMDGWVVATRQP
jgi:hypothetical protein